MAVLYVFIVFFGIATFLPATENPHWAFRMPDFVRVQSMIVQALLLALLIYFRENLSSFDWVLVFFLIFTICYQLEKTARYTFIFPAKKKPFKSDGQVSIFAGNVFQDNPEHQQFLKQVKHFGPDLVLTMETDKAWEKSLSVLEQEYPFQVKIPLENYYGMHLYSKMELTNVSIKYQTEADVPAIFFEFPLKNGKTIFFACLHPAPPSPTENDTAKERDAELLMTGKHIKNLKIPAVVCGDMNDVVWSRNTRRFKKLTGMIDPRVGRGFYSTYHAKYFFFRFPIDHLFHTKDLFIGKMQRSKFFGSDHFAMYYEIHYSLRSRTPKEPKLNGDEKEKVEEVIEDGKK